MAAGDEMDYDLEDDDAWDECEEAEGMPAQCLYCSSIEPTACDTLKHCYQTHQFNIVQLQEKFKLDCIQYIQLINFIRSTNCTELTDASLWTKEEYLKPVLPNDGLLMFDIESAEQELGETMRGAGNTAASAMASVELTGAQHEELLQRLAQAEHRACKAEEECQLAMDNMEQMKRSAQRLMEAIPERSTEVHPVGAVAALDLSEDSGYIDSYSHFSIHGEMLQDVVRTKSYQDSIMKNADLFKDKVVLDIGCGTGILSMFAAKAGAKKVIGIDMATVAYNAMDIVRENNLHNVITVFKDKVENVQLPVEKVDIIISEWMGYFLLFESMLDTVIFARDKWLKPGGLVLPSHCTMLIAGQADPELYHRQIGYWKDVYGFQMSAMRRAVSKESHITHTKADKVITQSSVIQDIDCTRASCSDLDFESSFELRVTKTESMTAFVGYFDTFFRDLTNEVSFSTGPQAVRTHWQQTVFFLPEPRPVTEGEVLKVKIGVRKLPDDPRSLRVAFQIGDEETLSYKVQ